MTELTDRFAGKVAVVTGAASGIGRAIATRFVAEGAEVVLADSNEPGLREVAASLGERAFAVAGDISEPDDVERFIGAAADGLGSLDVLVNNAATFRPGIFPDLSLEEWELVHRVNSTGTFLMSQAAAREMIRLPRRDELSRAIVNISSLEARLVVAVSGRPHVHYSASKAAVEMLTRSLAVELAPADIRVNAVCPGLVHTALTAEALADEATLDFYLAKIPLKRAATPEEIASVALFLASADASYMTGTSVVVDGGWMTQ